MKKFFLACVAALFLPLMAHAQLFVRGGYLVGAAPNKVINDLVNRYNTARPWLEQPMPTFEYMHGPAASLGARLGNYTMDLTWKRLRQVGTAPERDSLGNPATRDLILRSDNFNYGCSVDLATSRVFSLGMGLTLDFNMLAVLSEVTGQGKQTLGNSIGLGLGAQLPILVHIGGGVGIELVPYLSYPFNKTDLYPVLQQLDPTNAPNQPTDGFKQAFLNYGLSMYLRLGGYPE